MSLLLRVNAALVVVFALGALITGLACRSLLQANAEREIRDDAELMMDSALAARDYTASEIAPLLHAQMQSQFLPQSVPFYAATEHFLRLHAARPDYSYQEATLNPTNPRDRATDWQTDIIERFRSDAAMHEFSGLRDTPLGRSLYLAKPIRASAECLSCHGTAASAPPTVLARYGSANGFGWQVGAHLAVGHLLIADLLMPSHGLEANIDYLHVSSPEELASGLERLGRFPEMHQGIRVRGRLKAEQYRASRLFSRVVYDLLADVSAFGRVDAPA